MYWFIHHIIKRYCFFIKNRYKLIKNSDKLYDKNDKLSTDFIIYNDKILKNKKIEVKKE